MQLTNKQRFRFWSKVAFTESCWLWMHTTNKSGHGRVGLGKKLFQTHRISWNLFNGSIPEGLCVLHKCDVPNCVNPSHLFLGTKLDNAVDRDSKGRGLKGNKVHTSKLTPEQVLEIRKASGSFAEIGRRFGVSPPTISGIIKGKYWKHI